MRAALRLSVLAIAAAFLAGSATAADIASFRPIGFSPDGRVFAFEEFGIQDGSGFPYSNIYVLDLEKDGYLQGTPYRVRLDDEKATLAEARRQARDKAEGLIASHELADNPGEILAFNPVTEVDADPHRLRYRDYAVVPPVGEPDTLTLEEIPQEPDDRCSGMVEKMAAFRLRITEEDGKPADQLIHEDQRVPASRGCATGYRLAGVMGGTAMDRSPFKVALVMVLSLGFEGSDGRWIAVPIKAAP
ncbi:DUF2259 domain-containing protein [Rhizobium sp. LC145]|uniref:DUF2259 domain-containing protein n=1 Tax=Rhizobium sp. LC145 TaxID=1120688 RepID=UPI00062A4341|nr:DUF2259 domain-containing protein [Rhizobium sp. LC145]KKX33842.1 hypothetical protein YH62_01290 [Rhizobium sp. LC145]TKT60050.1 DUF2259 domain-containing protein [Rhizobiaceae bacterium LC148]